MSEQWERLRESVREQLRFKREHVRTYFHRALDDLEGAVLAQIHLAEGAVAAGEESLKSRLEAVESRMHVAETRLDAHAEAIAPGGHDGHLMTHVESRLEKVERDTLPTRVGTGVAPTPAKYPGEGEAWRTTAHGAQY